MFVSTHIDMTQTVLSALCWPGDIKLAARSAAWPDAARVTEVEGLGAHVFGRNLAGLCHFVRPIGDGRFEGYCWPEDRSVPHLDLTGRKVVPCPEAWGFPAVEPLLQDEPLAKLVRDLQQPGHVGTIEADRIGYPAASTMADWMASLWAHWIDAPKGPLPRHEALDTLVGWMMHLAVQDPVVPHHRLGILLDGHSAFEADVEEAWNRMKARGEVDVLLRSHLAITRDGLVHGRYEPVMVRRLAEQIAGKWTPSPRRLCFYRWFWRRGWNRQVRDCVVGGLLGSVWLGKILLESRRAAGG